MIKGICTNKLLLYSLVIEKLKVLLFPIFKNMLFFSSSLWWSFCIALMRKTLWILTGWIPVLLVGKVPGIVEALYRELGY